MYICTLTRAITQVTEGVAIYFFENKRKWNRMDYVNDYFMVDVFGCPMSNQIKLYEYILIKL